jgi:excisionase family DNA binding protein
MDDCIRPERFVDNIEAANFLNVPPRRINEMARKGEIPAHPLGTGLRKTWRFRLSEIAAHIATSQSTKKVR